ncbi:MAG: mechanosensitive ion channel family protein, partial [Anaerolineae bacterium]|nr:mechanosensitive ion channel family protein [Anaerolineae bacterium]
PLMLTDFLEDTLGHDAADLITRLLLVAVILILTWVIRQIITAIIPSLIGKLTKRTETRLDDQLIEAVRPPLRLLILVGGGWVAILALEPDADLQNTLRHVFDALTAYGLFWAMFRLVQPVVRLIVHLSRRTMAQTAIPTLLEEKLATVLGQVARAVIVLLGFSSILESWGYNVAGLVAGLGLAGAAVALAVKDTLANLFGYFVILADEPFTPGEYVVFDGIQGTVEFIGFRSTRIRVLDQSLVTVPNNTVSNANVTNWSRLSKRRLNMTLGIDYNSSPQQILLVVQAIRKMLMEHELVQADSVTVQFVEFNDSSLDLMIICFMETPAWGDFQAAKQDINLRIMDILAERNVGVAFPSRTVYVEQVTAPAPERFVSPPDPEPTASTASDSPVPDDAAN